MGLVNRNAATVLQLAHDLCQPADVVVPSSGAARKPRSRKSILGQYFTPPVIAAFMARLFKPDPRNFKLLDAGAGQGALAMAFVARFASAAETIKVHAYEIDEDVLDTLRANLADMPAGCRALCEIFDGDFIERAAKMVRLEAGERYSHAILNPPYKKIGSNSPHRALLSAAGLETVNLYSGFVGLALALLEDGGELVAIIPRSFCNGPYYRPFRRFVLGRAAIRHIHLFGARDKTFKQDGVLQENVIIHLVRGAKQDAVTVSTSSDGGFGDYSEMRHPFSSIVASDDDNKFIHIPTDDSDALVWPCGCAFGLAELGLSISTGPVVDFRLRDHLLADAEPGAAPLLYPGHFNGDRIVWPKAGFKKPNAIRDTAETRKWLLPSGFYTVIRRFSAKEEARRVVAGVVDPAALAGTGMIGFENHLNVVHANRRPLDEDVARGISVYLNSTFIDRIFRRFNGHTQVNATDLRALRYPSVEALKRLGGWSKLNPQASQDAIDAQVAAVQ